MNVNPSGLDLLGYTDCFVRVVSGSEVIKGIGPYLVIAIGPKSFNGHIMMGTSVAAAPAHSRLKPEPESATILAELSHRLLSCRFS